MSIITGSLVDTRSIYISYSDEESKSFYTYMIDNNILHCKEMVDIVCEYLKEYVTETYSGVGDRDVEHYGHMWNGVKTGMWFEHYIQNDKSVTGHGYLTMYGIYKGGLRHGCWKVIFYNKLDNIYGVYMNGTLCWEYYSNTHKLYIFKNGKTTIYGDNDIYLSEDGNWRRFPSFEIIHEEVDIDEDVLSSEMIDDNIRII